jgi:hypothetical protein
LLLFGLPNLLVLLQVSSEKSKCTITDLCRTTNTASNTNSNGEFTWEELGGTPLTFKQRCRLFRLRHGIELVDDAKKNINSAIRMKYTDEMKVLENAS